MQILIKCTFLVLLLSCYSFANDDYDVSGGSGGEADDKSSGPSPYSDEYNA